MLDSLANVALAYANSLFLIPEVLSDFILLTKIIIFWCISRTTDLINIPNLIICLF